MATNHPLDDYDYLSHAEYKTVQGSNLVSEPDTDDSMFDQSESSLNSMTTIRSDQMADYFQSVFGFQYESNEGVPRIFPANLSSERLDIIMHVIYRLLRGGTNVPSRVDEMIRRGGVDGNQGVPRVLEVVTNSGVWVREMADAYPLAAFVSIDTKPLVLHTPHARINYDVYDFYTEILEPDASFDVVYTKYGAPATKDFNFLLRELHRVLKPNGFLLMDVFPIRVFEGANADVPVHSSIPIADGIRFARGLWERQGVDTATWDDLPLRLDPSHVHWGNSQSVEAQPQSGSGPIRGFHAIDLRKEIHPFGMWLENEQEKIIGGLMRLWVEITWRNHLPNMLAVGMEEEEARAFVERFLKDLADLDKFELYYELQLMCAQKMQQY